MSSFVQKLWESLRTTFWFLPSMMTVTAGALAVGVVAVDRITPNATLRGLNWAYNGGAEGASVLLGTIASSMVTIAGVVFSMTLVALSLASSQLGPRLLRNFMRDRSNQAVLGTFVATFVYCLLVLRTIRRFDEDPFVPHLAVTLAVAFALASLGVLIYFIHHVAMSVQADEVIGRVADELFEGIERLFPEAAGSGSGNAILPVLTTSLLSGAGGVTTAATRDGYLQIVDLDRLVELAEGLDAVFRVERRPGQYVVRGEPLVTVCNEARVPEDLRETINAAFTVGYQRTAVHDIEFSINQLVEIAVRALSPGVNDPFTAITCVDRLGSALRRLAERDMPLGFRNDQQGRLRLIVPTTDFAHVVDVAFRLIRQYARDSTEVSIRLIESMMTIAGGVHRPEDLNALRRQVEMIADASRSSIPQAGDRLAVEERIGAAMRMLVPPAAVDEHQQQRPPA